MSLKKFIHNDATMERQIVCVECQKVLASITDEAAMRGMRLPVFIRDSHECQVNDNGGGAGMSAAELHKCACCEELTVGFFCRACEKAGCCMINGAKCGRF